jgi:hypothetical protein
VILLLAVCVGCTPASTQPTQQPPASATEPQATPTETISTATAEPLAPAGWLLHNSQRCEYTISYPSEMQVNYEGAYSRTLGFQLTNPEEGARNFLYVSVIISEIRSMGEGIYNYDPAEAEILLNMEVGERKSVRELPDPTAWTYQRKPDTPISGLPARVYENTQPWEFPGGTKEIRYFLSLDGCTYIIGGYLDTTGLSQPGAITEELFSQIVATIRLNP